MLKKIRFAGMKYFMLNSLVMIAFVIISSPLCQAIDVIYEHHVAYSDVVICKWCSDEVKTSGAFDKIPEMGYDIWVTGVLNARVKVIVMGSDGTMDKQVDTNKSFTQYHKLTSSNLKGYVYPIKFKTIVSCEGAGLGDSVRGNIAIYAHPDN
ncbi:MAG: hypothetical protein K8R45_01270 [Desulfobacterales bacterium]|nr:hypothetical protein [Desulfobacterales bacterium]